MVKNRKKEESELISEIVALSSQLPDNLSEDNRNRLQILKLDSIYIYKAEGAFVHSKRRWLEEGEQNSSYFFKLEKQHHNINSMAKLCSGGVTTQDPKEISQICEIFSKNLYKSQLSTNDMESFFNSLGDSNANKELCDAPITVTDSEDAIKKRKLNKSPGNDGLTSELFKLFP